MRAVRQSALFLLLPGLAAAQSAVLQVHVLEGQGAYHAPGARAARFLTVKVTDDLGKPVPSAQVTFRLPEDGPGGIFENGLPTEVVTTAPDGTATAPAARWNRVPGAFDVRVVAATALSRAGTVVPMYLSDRAPPVNGHASHGASALVTARPKRRYGWLAVGLAVGGAAAVGFSRGWFRRPPRPASSGSEPPRVGSPVIIVGRP